MSTSSDRPLLTVKMTRHWPSIHKDHGKEAKPPFDVPVILLRWDLAFIHKSFTSSQVHGRIVIYKSTCQI